MKTGGRVKVHSFGLSKGLSTHLSLTLLFAQLKPLNVREKTVGHVH